MDVLVARQPIFDRQQKLHGYELLFRSDSANNRFDGTEDAAATMQVLSNTLMSIGADDLLQGKKAFINFNHRLLEASMHLTLPRESMVIEILETVAPTQDLVALCQSIKQQGYSLALDDFTDDASFQPLTFLANIIKVDLLLTSPEEQERMLRTYKPRGVLMLAEKVESHAEYERAWRAGFDLFQGYFFAKPAVMRGRQIPALKVACLRLLREVQEEDLDFQRLEQLIREDVSLTYKLLRYVNSALFAHRDQIHSITRALLVVGDDGIRRWAALATLPMLATDKPPELITLSLVRARFCEKLAELAHAARPNDAFLMGMFSLLDALIDQPLDLALRSVDLGEEVSAALLGTAPESDFLGCLCRLIQCYESGQWDEAEQWCLKCGLPPATVRESYLEATAWGSSITRELEPALSTPAVKLAAGRSRILASS